ncbi:TPA: hypothetical protein ACKARV_001993 [Streptococcus pneumoniae]
MLQLKLVKQEIEAEKPASVEAWIISVKLKKVATDIYRFQKQKIEAEKPASVEAWIISVKLKKVATDIYRFQKQKR